MRRKRFLTLTTAGMTTLALGARAVAQTFNPPPPTASLSIGNMRFDKYGQGDPALILVPGISMGAWTWASAIKVFERDHLMYAATLAGFDGTPPARPPYLSQADASIVALIKQEGLKRPVIIGHSLGGHLVLRMIEEHPVLFAGAVVVDATPFFPPLQPGQTLAQRNASIDLLADSIRSAPDPIYAAQTRATVASMVSSQADVDTVTQHALRTDRSTLAGVTTELSEDLRPGLPRIAVPTLIVAPVSRDAPYMTDALRALTQKQLDDTIRNWYAGQFEGARTVSVQTIDGSKHFVMLDQPDALNAAIGAFLAHLR